jgi:radical SAM protein with 4Fe4S-binding SPASM domain
MRPDIYQLISYAKEVGLYPGVSTNATLLSTEAAEKLKRVGLRTLTIGLYGANAKSHDDFTGIEGSWERSMVGINNAKKAGIPFQMNICIHRDNLGQFEAIVKLARELGAQAIKIFGFMPVGRGGRHPELVLTPQERKHLVNQIVPPRLDDGQIIYECIGIPQFWVEMDKVIPEERKMRFTPTCCSAGLRYCCLFYEGTVYPCMVLQKRAGNIRQQSFQQIWYKSGVFNTLRNRDKLEGKCGRCDYRYICGGARCQVYIKTGSLTKEDAACWFSKEELRKKVVV